MSGAKKNQYVRKVEEEVDKLLDIYGKILQSSTIVSPDEMTMNDQGETGLLPTQTDRENAQLHFYAEHLVQVTEGLFTLITELKHAALVSDAASMLENSMVVQKDFASRATAVEVELVQLQNDVKDMVLELENAYFSSPYR